MFEKEIADYSSNITKRFTSEIVPLTSILQDAELPEGFRRFAEAEVEDILDMEELGKSRTGKVDMSLPEVRTLLKEVRQVLKKSFQFPRKEFNELAERISRFQFDYIIRPKWTIEKLLFKTDTEIDRVAVERASRYFSDYSYYQRGITEYMEFSGRDRLDRESWTKVHSRIDEHLIDMLPSKASILTSALFSLFKFSSGDDKVPIESVILFFRDKEAEDIVRWIEAAMESKDLRLVDPITVSMMLEAALKATGQKEAAFPASLQSKRTVDSDERINSALVKEQVDPIHPPAEVSNVGQLVDAPSAQARGVAREASGVNVPSRSGTKTGAPSVRSFLTDKAEVKIIKRIFGGSRSSYQVAIHRLDESADWQSASRIVEEIFMEGEIDPFSKYAVAFTDAVSARFRIRK